ncbi:MAG: cobalamin biosynthesis protein CbiX [marine bacterium B5-7]|nr:MAG: cobalamin biosynthesis protein CbiX [marine bacterium B5-7]
MSAILLVAHGSRRQRSNDEIRELTNAVRAVNDRYDIIECAFLELAEPSIPDGLIALIERGETDIVVMPYFLSAGRHVVEDIPNEIATVTEAYSDVVIRLAPYLGASDAMARLLLEQSIRHDPTAR